MQLGRSLGRLRSPACRRRGWVFTAGRKFLVGASFTLALPFTWDSSARAQQVAVEEKDYLVTFDENPGLLVTTSISTKYLPAREAVTTLQLYFADSATEAIRNIEGTDTILMTGFANNLQGIVRLLKEIDKEPDDAYPNVVRRKLNHAVADEIQPVLKDLIDAYMGTGRPG